MRVFQVADGFDEIVLRRGEKIVRRRQCGLGLRDFHHGYRKGGLRLGELLLGLYQGGFRGGLGLRIVAGSGDSRFGFGNSRGSGCDSGLRRRCRRLGLVHRGRCAVHGRLGGLDGVFRHGDGGAGRVDRLLGGGGGLLRRIQARGIVAQPFQLLLELVQRGTLVVKPLPLRRLNGLLRFVGDSGDGRRVADQAGQRRDAVQDQRHRGHVLRLGDKRIGFDFILVGFVGRVQHVVPEQSQKLGQIDRDGFGQRQRQGGAGGTQTDLDGAVFPVNGQSLLRFAAGGLLFDGRRGVQFVHLLFLNGLLFFKASFPENIVIQ